MEQFNIILYDVNHNSLKTYDVIPYFISEYKENLKHRKKNSYYEYHKIPTNIEELKQFIINKSKYRFWSRCEYEIIISDWPPSGFNEKIDAHYQIMMNIDLITKIVAKELNIE